MATTKRRSNRVMQSAGLRKNQVEYFLLGTYFGRGEAFPSAEAELAAWREYFEALLDAWFTREPELFCRPAAWWRFDAPEPRRRTRGEGPAESVDWFGTPGIAGSPDETFETQFSFFRRHPELLTAAERRMQLGPATIRWRQMPDSEMAETGYLLDHLWLLSDSSRAAFEAHLAERNLDSTGPEHSGRTQ